MRASLSDRTTRTLLAFGFVTLSACAPAGNGDAPAPVDASGRPQPEEQMTVEGEEAPSQEEIDRALQENPVIENEPQATASQLSSALARYPHLDRSNVVPNTMQARALVYWETYKSRFPNQRYISIIDYKRPSSQKRFWVINMSTGTVYSYYVAHGSGSDYNHDGYAERFSNVSGSNASSVGVFKASETYYGKYAYSMRLDGLSTTNSNARARAVVVHGSYYVYDKAVKQGRSWGCPAIPMHQRTALIDMIKNGSMIYAIPDGY